MIPSLPGPHPDELEPLELVGEGGQARVWRCRRKGPNPALYALKELREGASADRFHQEAVVLSRLSHPHIVRLFGLASNPWRQVLQWVDGPPLAHLVGRSGALSADRVARIGTALALALAQAHSRRIFHRDPSPENILLATGDHAVWIDFGIGFPEGGATLTELDSVVGTPVYMAPEAFETSRQFPRQRDIYGLGVVLVWCLDGTTPFHEVEESATNDEAALSDLMNLKTTLPWLEPRAAIPDALRTALRRMTAREPWNRTPTMDEVARELAK